MSTNPKAWPDDGLPGGKTPILAALALLLMKQIPKQPCRYSMLMRGVIFSYAFKCQFELVKWPRCWHSKRFSPP